MPLTIIKPDFIVNQTTQGLQRGGDVTRLQDGRILVTWTDWTAGGGDIKGRFLDAAGNPIGGEFTAVGGPSPQSAASTTVLTDGRILIAWTDQQSTYPYLRAKILNPDGTQSVAEFVVGPPSGFFFSPEVLALPGGGFAVGGAFTDFGSAASSTQFYLYNSNATPAGVNYATPSTSNDVGDVEIVRLANGRIMLTWTELYVSNRIGNRDVKALILNADGTVHRDTWTIDVQGSECAIKVLSNGNILVAWYDYGPGARTTRATVLNANGDTIVPSFVVYGDSGDGVEAVTLSDGRFAIAWYDLVNAGNGTTGEIFVKVFNADGTVSIAQQSVKSLPLSQHLTRANIGLQALPNGQIVLTWWDGQGGDDEEIHAIVIGTQTSTTPSPGPDILTGTAANNAIDGLGGNDSISGLGGNDVLRGGLGNDTLNGGDGIDYLNGGAGADVLVGGAGTDYAQYVNAATGITIRLDLPSLNTGEAAGDSYSGIEGVIGGSFGDTIVGNASVNYLFGLGGNDHVDGQGGNDGLYGGDGNDNLSGGIGADRLDGGAGFDYARYANATAALVIRLDVPSLNTGEAKGDTYFGIEGLIGGAFGDTIFGNAAINYLWGLAGNDYIDGLAGNDALYGGDGNDNLTGGAGADVLDGGLGFDYVRYVNAATALFIRLDVPSLNTGEAAGDTYAGIEGVIGGIYGDTVVGNAEINYLWGLAGNDYIDGLAGNDALYGGEGNDNLVGGAGADKLDGGNGYDFARYDAATAGVNARLDDASLNTGFAAGDVYVAIEGLIGSAFGDVLVGNTSNNVISGLAGNDALYGGLGNDKLTGGLGNDVLVGGAGVDEMEGGVGDDAYYLDSNLDITEEALNSGIDAVIASITHALRANIENLELLGGANLNGTGNALANQLVGNAGANILNGLAGADSMAGKLGNDTYYIDNAGDTVAEALNEGIDIVRSSVSITLSANIEKLYLIAGAANGTGNAITNFIYGNALANNLNGGAGADRLLGFGGGDTYTVDSSGDRVFESIAGAAGGTDTVNASVNHTLSTNVENLNLTGTGDIRATGNVLANTIAGNAGDNFIDGKQGSDTLTGGLGEDNFVFTTALGTDNVDTITDFAVSADTLRLDNAVFTGLALGYLDAAAFHSGASATDATDRIIYNAATGDLFFDADGAGGAAQVRFAILDTGLAMTSADIYVF